MLSLVFVLGVGVGDIGEGLSKGAREGWSYRLFSFLIFIFEGKVGSHVCRNLRPSLL